MATSKHVRKTGATTIKRHGKIVGNIGAGKNRVPTAQKTVQNLSESSDSSDSFVHTMWILTENQPLTARLNVLYNAGQELPKNKRKNVLKELLRSNHNLSMQIAQVLGTIKMTDLRPETLQWLSEYNNLKWREQLAKNPKTPIDIRRKIASYSNPKLQQAIITNFAVTPEELHEIASNTKDAKTLMYVAMHKNLLPETSEVLGRSNSGAARAIVARQTSSAKLLERLSYDPLSHVRSTVAQNPHTPVEVLKRLATKDVSENVRRATHYSQNF